MTPRDHSPTRPDTAFRDAWTRELDRARTGWWAYALHLTGNRHHAEDLLQHTLLRLLERGLHPGDIAAGYVYRTMRNAWITTQRRPPLRSSPPTAIEPVAPTRPLQDDTLTNALAALGEEEREVITLKHAGGLTLEQIATVTGRPLGTVAGQHRRALIALRAALAPEITP